MLYEVITENNTVYMFLANNEVIAGLNEDNSLESKIKEFTEKNELLYPGRADTEDKIILKDFDSEYIIHIVPISLSFGINDMYVISYNFV